METSALELEEVLAKRLTEAGVLVRQANDTPDLLVELGHTRFFVECRTARDARAPVLRGFLAEGLLEARARGSDEPPLLPIVGAPRMSDQLIEMLQRFVARVAPGQPWGIMDGRGRLEIFSTEPPLALPPEEESAKSALRSPRPSLFTDVHEWLLKNLLAPALPPELLAASRERVTSTRSLARAAGVSVGSAARFLATFEAEGFVERGRGWIRWRRSGELLEAWRTASRPRSAPSGFRWAIAPARGEDPLPTVLEKLDQASISRCIGLHRACEALGLGFVKGVKPVVYVDRLDEAAEALAAVGLAPSTSAEEPDLFVEVPRAPRSCFAGAVQRGDLRVTDVLQSWLDVSWHPARGEEQADSIWHRVLAPRLLSDEEAV